MNHQDSFFGRIAVHHGFITIDQLVSATTAQAQELGHRKLGDIFIERGQMTEADVEQVLATQSEVLAKRKSNQEEQARRLAEEAKHRSTQPLPPAAIILGVPGGDTEELPARRRSARPSVPYSFTPKRSDAKEDAPEPGPPPLAPAPPQQTPSVSIDLAPPEAFVAEHGAGGSGDTGQTAPSSGQAAALVMPVAGSSGTGQREMGSYSMAPTAPMTSMPSPSDPPRMAAPGAARPPVMVPMAPATSAGDDVPLGPAYDAAVNAAGAMDVAMTMDPVEALGGGGAGAVPVHPTSHGPLPRGWTPAPGMPMDGGQPGPAPWSQVHPGAGPSVPGSPGHPGHMPLAPSPGGPQPSVSVPQGHPGAGPSTPSPVTPGPSEPAPPALTVAGKLAQSPERDQMEGLLTHAVQLAASDLHVHGGARVAVRVHGALQEIGQHILSAQESRALLLSILDEHQRRTLESDHQVDLAYSIPEVGRFRVSIYRQHRGLDGVFRLLPLTPPSLADLGLPSTLAKFTNYHQGLVLLTGPSGCGKSATMAALINIVNEERSEHILTIEDPIEVVHPSRRSVVNQREVGRNTTSFARALRGALREDPDIIAIGELRDLETISLALSAAETGHLVFGTLHTNSALRTVDRLIGVFPPQQQSQIRTMVSESLRGIISQRLVPAADGSGRVPAVEVLMINKAAGNMVRDGKTFQIRDIMQTGGQQGMCLLDNALASLVASGTISKEEARRQAEDPRRFK